MTTLGLNWEQHLEASRHNAAQEAETLRHNIAMEKESKRAAQEIEKLRKGELDLATLVHQENERKNKKAEEQRGQELNEKERADRETERNARLTLAFKNADKLFSTLAGNGLLTQEIANDFVGVADNFIRILAGVDVNDQTSNNLLTAITTWVEQLKNTSSGNPSGSGDPSEAFNSTLEDAMEQYYVELKEQTSPTSSITPPPKLTTPKSFTFEEEEPATWSTAETRKWMDEQVKTSGRNIWKTGEWLGQNFDPSDLGRRKTLEAYEDPRKKSTSNGVLYDKYGAVIAPGKQYSDKDYMAGDIY